MNTLDKSKRGAFRRGIVTAALVVLVCGYCAIAPRRQQVVAVSERNPIGGDFRIRGNDVISVDVREPRITFKPAAELKDPQVAEPTEPWMNNAGETLNRETVSFLRGTLDGGLKRYFRQPGQRAVWWYSKDWNVQYLATKWMDYKLPEPANGLAPQKTKLWRSGDGGLRWTQLKWPEGSDIDRLFFLDPERGYAIGWGPHVWRTDDGGQTWQQIELPPMANDYRYPRKTFDAVDLGPDGTLRVAYYLEILGDIRLSSVVYRLRWDEVKFESDVVFPHQVVIRLGSTDELTGHTYSIYALSMLGLPRNYDDSKDEGTRVSALSTWTSIQGSVVTQLYAFDRKLRFDLHENSLQVGKGGVLFVYGTSFRRDVPDDIDLVSYNAGRSWDEYLDRYLPGGYFDKETNTQYGLAVGAITRRKF